MTGPIVLGAKTNVARLIALLVIPAERLEPGRACGFVEPDGREQPPRFLNALERRALALVRHRLGSKPGGANVILETDRRYLILVVAIMRQHAKSRAVAMRAQPRQMRRQR